MHKNRLVHVNVIVITYAHSTQLKADFGAQNFPLK